MWFRKAILIIHGFAGGTYDEEKLANYLELHRNYDVYQFTLPGHKRNLSKVKYTEWVQSSEEHIKWLIQKGYKKIYLVGHSMGGVLASYLATKYKEVKKLVLAAPAFKYITDKGDKLNFSDSIRSAPKIIKTYGKGEIISRFLKLTPSGIKEFMEFTKEYYNYPNLVNCPVLLLHGTNDNIIPISSSNYVYNSVSSKIKKIVILEGVTHDIFESDRFDDIYRIVERFLKKSESGEYKI